MIYVTIQQSHSLKQMSWEDYLFDLDPKLPKPYGDPTGTITRVMDSPSKQMMQNISVPDMINLLRRFNEKYRDLHLKDKNLLYDHFKIPKRTGGFRQIDAPHEELQSALRELVMLLDYKFGLKYHTSAFAYVKGRCITDAVKKHQYNESNWFLKTDFSGFFPSTTLDFAMKMLGMIWPVCEVVKDEEGRQELRKALSLGFLNGGLVQGSVLSPMLTNSIFIPIDHRLFNELTHHRFVYTRYADDIHISCVQSFEKDKIVNLIKDTLKAFDAPYEIKDEKTHYGSRKGKNFLLGVILNADNDIKIGWKKKKFFKAATTNLIMDYKNGKVWNADDVRHYEGLLSYYRMVEPEYFNELIKHFEEKFQVNVKRIIKASLNFGGW